MKKKINKFNKNIEKIKPYYISFFQENIKRMHANESEKPILDYDILMKNVAENLNYYSENKTLELVKKASEFYGISAEKIVATNGSDEGIDLCIRTFCNAGDTIVVPEPTFSMYEQYATAFGVNTKKINLKNASNFWILDEEEMIKVAEKTNAKMVFIPNPLANIGNTIEEEKIIKIITKLPNTIVVLDEAYIEFSGLEKSFLTDFYRFKNLVILRTFSKFFGLAGIRLGFLFTHFTNEIIKIKSPYNINVLSCQIGINVFSKIDKNLINKRREKILQKRLDLENWLKQFKEVEKLFKSETNFIFIKLNCKSEDFAKKMLDEYKIKVKTFSGAFENYCRISVL